MTFSGYSITGADAADFELIQPTPTTANITAAPLTINASSQIQSYGFGGTSAALGTTDFTVSGLVGSDSVTSVRLSTSATLSGSSNYDAGTWSITPSAPIGSGLGNYTLTAVNGTLQINPVALTVTANNQSRSYGDLNPALTYTITGFVNGDFLDQSKLSGSPDVTTTAVDYTSPAGIYPISITQNLQGPLSYADPNYTLANAPFVDGKLTIETVPLEVIVNSLTRVYGSANPSLTCYYSGFVNNESQSVLTGMPSVSTVATATSPVGSYSITVKVGSLWSPNYTFTFESATLTVAPAVLTVTAADATRAYGATNPTVSCDITGFVNNQTEATSDVTGSPIISTAATTTSPVGSYAITPSAGTLESKDYTFDFQAGTLTVSPAVLTLTAVNASRAYGVANPTLTYTISGFANGETATTGGVTGTPALSTTAVTSSSVGVYPITVGLGTLSATNYTFQSGGPGTLTITPALLIVQAQNLQRSYDIPNPSLTYLLVLEDQPQTAVSAATSQASDAPTLSTQADINSPVGTYSITPSLGTLAIGNPNYVLDVPNFQSGTLTITPATLTFTANADSRVYGAANPTFTATITGFIGGQTLATSGVTGAPAFTTTASTTSGVGNSYEIIPYAGSLESANYQFSFLPGILTITPAPLTIEANNTSQSFGTKPSLSVSYVGLVNGDTAASLTRAPVLSTTATENSLPGSYPIVVSGASSTNYTITYKNGTYTVMQSSTTAVLEGPLLRSNVTSPVIFTVDVSSSSLSSVPLTGLVIFYDQAQVIGEAAVVNGVATLTTSGLTKGNYMIYAVYQGDNNFQTSSTGTIVQMIMSTAAATPVKRTAPVPAHRKVTPKPKAKPQPKPKAPAAKPVAHPVAVKQSRALSR